MAVSKKHVLKFLFEEDYKPLTFEGLRKVLGISQDKDVQELFRFLVSLEEEGVVYKTLQGRYSPLRGRGLLIGVLQGHPQGYAFLLPEALWRQMFLYLRRGSKGHKDRVMVRLLGKVPNGRRREGRYHILKRATLLS